MSGIRYVGVKELEEAGPEALLIDVREPAEFAGRWLPGSVNVPLSRFDDLAPQLPRGKAIIVLCQSGSRAKEAARRLAAQGFPDVRVMEGGLGACESGRLRRGRGPWAMERQVRMAAGTLILCGAALGSLVHPRFWWLSALIGAGLAFSAATDTCGMARVLSKMPWNKPRA